MTVVTPIQLANAIDEMAENPKGGKMAAIAYRQAAKLIRSKLVDPATEDAQRADHLRDLLRRAISYGGIEPQLDQEIKDALRAPCRVCGGSGFSGMGTGYDAVCSECGGLRYIPDDSHSLTNGVLNAKEPG